MTKLIGNIFGSEACAVGGVLKPGLPGGAASSGAAKSSTDTFLIYSDHSEADSGGGGGSGEASSCLREKGAVGILISDGIVGVGEDKGVEDGIKDGGGKAGREKGGGGGGGAAAEGSAAAALGELTTLTLGNMMGSGSAGFGHSQVSTVRGNEVAEALLFR